MMDFEQADPDKGFPLGYKWWPVEKICDLFGFSRSHFDATWRKQLSDDAVQRHDRRNYYFIGDVRAIWEDEVRSGKWKQ